MRGLVAFLVFIAAQVFLWASAVAAPDDFRLLSGTLLHPATLGSDVTVAVLQREERAFFYIGLRAGSGIPTLERGATVTVVGFEGSHPAQLAAQVIYPPDFTPAPADAPTGRSGRIHCRIWS